MTTTGKHQLRLKSGSKGSYGTSHAVVAGKWCAAHSVRNGGQHVRSPNGGEYLPLDGARELSPHRVVFSR